MSSERIFEELTDAWHDVTSHLHHTELPSAPQPHEEAPMTTPAPAATDTATDAKPTVSEAFAAKLDEVKAEVGGWFDNLKTEAAPVVDKAQQYETKIEADPFIGRYLAANFAVPEHLVDLGLDFLAKLVSASEPAAPAAPAQAA